MREAIQFSGGKDSTALMYLMRDRLKDVPVYFGDTGDAYPHMLKFVRETCEKLGATLKVIKPSGPIAEFQKNFGLPSDIVPAETMFHMQAFLKDKKPVILQSSLSCCAAMLWRPIYEATLADGITMVYRGSKAADGHVGVPDGHVDERGITYRSPLWDWTDEDVFAYLKDVGAELPEHYSAVNSSFDCIGCTAYLNHPGAADRLKWTREHYPERWPAIEHRLRLVREVVDGERAAVSDAFDVLEAL